jgi:lipoprotein-anchoring transpeptidase ErfK/SrfK
MAGVVVAVLVAVVGAVGIAAMAHAAQSNPAMVLPPVPAPAASPPMMVNRPPSAAASPVKPTAIVPTTSAITTIPAAAVTSPSSAAPQTGAVQVKPALTPPVAAAAQPQASTTAQKTEPVPQPVTTGSAASYPATATLRASSSAHSPSAMIPPVSAQAVVSPSAAAVAPKTAVAPHLIYAAIPQNAPTTPKPVGAPVNAAAQSKPVSANPDAVPMWAPDLPPRVAAQPAAAPTALAAILPPSAAHPEYLQFKGITPGERMHEEDDDAIRADPANWIVRIFKHNHRLEVYYRDNLYKSYHAVFGRSLWPGAKELENDRRTPEGDYMIVQKHPSYRFDWFLKLNYPNADDREHFEELRDDGKIPRWAREGGQVGIHGTDDPILNVGDVNWTTGCISIDNEDIAELARLLPIGTVVIIKP